MEVINHEADAAALCAALARRTIATCAIGRHLTDPNFCGLFFQR
jgi:hypothetical protein